MVDDAQAFTMEAFDWYSEAARRFLVALVVGAVYGGVLYVVNRRCLWSRFLGTFGRHLPLVLAVGIILAGAAGAIRFVVIRPFM